jgi:hypothetical protein
VKPLGEADRDAGILSHETAQCFAEIRVQDLVGIALDEKRGLDIADPAFHGLRERGDIAIDDDIRRRCRLVLQAIDALVQPFSPIVDRRAVTSDFIGIIQ